MEPEQTKTYSPEEVNRIIQRALQPQKSEGIRHEELLEIGRELGLDAHTVEAAVAKEQDDHARRRAMENWRKSRKFGFQWHLWSYLITNTVLFLINAAVPGPWWFQWSVIGWGIGLVVHFQRVYFPSRPQIQRAFQKQSEDMHF